jgi:hypothetical protein
MKTNKGLELLHYVVVYGVLLLSWVPVMDYFKQELIPTALTVGVIFILADQLAHKIILGEDYSLI